MAPSRRGLLVLFIFLNSVFSNFRYVGNYSTLHQELTFGSQGWKTLRLVSWWCFPARLGSSIKESFLFLILVICLVFILFCLVKKNISFSFTICKYLLVYVFLLLVIILVFTIFSYCLFIFGLVTICIYWALAHLFHWFGFCVLKKKNLFKKSF